MCMFQVMRPLIFFASPDDASAVVSPSFSSSGVVASPSFSSSGGATNSPGKRGLIPVPRPFDILAAYGRPEVPRLRSPSPDPYEQVAATNVVEPSAVGLHRFFPSGSIPANGSIPDSGFMPNTNPSGSIPVSGSIPDACVNSGNQNVFLSLCPIIPCRICGVDFEPISGEESYGKCQNCMSATFNAFAATHCIELVREYGREVEGASIGATPDTTHPAALEPPDCASSASALQPVCSALPPPKRARCSVIAAVHRKGGPPK
jgi:hypothetical protein